MSETSAGGNPPRTVRVWDPVVRLFHWTVVIAVCLNLFVLKPGRLYHRYAGYVVIGAVLIRLVWGFIGTRHARFGDFFPTPSRLIPYLKALFRREEPRHLGHNPAAAVMMLALMALFPWPPKRVRVPSPFQNSGAVRLAWLRWAQPARDHQRSRW